MPDVETYRFSHKEIVELLIKASDVHDGQWMLQVNFGFSAGNMGPDEDGVAPAAIAIVSGIGITRAKEDSPQALVVDAAKVNPAPST